MLDEIITTPVKISYNKSTSQQVFDFLNNEIISMKLLPGQKIPETKLAQQFGVSRTPIREAIATLTNLGLVEVRPQRGTFVSKLSIKKIIEARFIREALEIAVVSYVAANHTPALIAECEDIIRQQKVATDANDPLAFQKLDDAFHQKLTDFMQFDRVTNMIKSEKAHIDRVRNLSLKELTGQYVKMLDQHLQILEAIKASDVEQAIELTSKHLHEILKFLPAVEKIHPEYFE